MAITSIDLDAIRSALTRETALSHTDSAVLAFAQLEASFQKMERTCRLLIEAFENKDFLNLVDQAFREAKGALTLLDGHGGIAA
jgi:hypothetical protein